MRTMRARSFSFSLFSSLARSPCKKYMVDISSIHRNHTYHPSIHPRQQPNCQRIVKCIIENDCGGKTASYIFREMKVRRNNDFSTTIKNVKCTFYIHKYERASVCVCVCAGSALRCGTECTCQRIQLQKLCVRLLLAAVSLHYNLNVDDNDTKNARDNDVARAATQTGRKRNGGKFTDSGERASLFFAFVCCSSPSAVCVYLRNVQLYLLTLSRRLDRI